MTPLCLVERLNEVLSFSSRLVEPASETQVVSSIGAKICRPCDLTPSSSALTSCSVCMSASSVTECLDPRD